MTGTGGELFGRTATRSPLTERRDLTNDCVTPVSVVLRDSVLFLSHAGELPSPLSSN
jgi:hypothetical protein